MNLIKDAFLVPTGSVREAKAIISQLGAEAGIGAGDVSEKTLRILLEGALADGVQNQSLPAPGFLDVIETCSMLDLRPQELELEAMLAMADPQHMVRNTSVETRDRWCDDDYARADLEDIMDSWFEDTKETREIMASGESVSEIEAKIWKFFENRRDIWARRFLQTAVMLRDSKKHRTWKILAASAYDLISDRPLEDIPLMDHVVDTTFVAGQENMW